MASSITASAALIATDVAQAGFQMTQASMGAAAPSMRSGKWSGELIVALSVKAHVAHTAVNVASLGSLPTLTALLLTADAEIGGET